MSTLCENIQRALRTPCTADILGHFMGAPIGLSIAARKRLLDRGQSVTDFAESIGEKRNSVSLVIHGRRRMPGVEAAVRKELGL